MAAYNRLIAGTGYLKHIRIKASRANGLTEADLREAELHAKAVIDERLGPLFQTSFWTHETPGVIERVADQLSSAEALRTRRLRGEAAPGEDVCPPRALERPAEALMSMIERGCVRIITRGGRVQRLRPGRRCAPTGRRQKEEAA
jgi:hypothetical protein